VRAIAPRPLFVLTGGDPMRRPDLADLVRYAADAGLTVALTPSGTAAATPRTARRPEGRGPVEESPSVSTGPTPETHDAFRRVRGSYAWTMRIIDAAIELRAAAADQLDVCKMTLPRSRARWRRACGVAAHTLGAVLSHSDRPRSRPRADHRG
jgi:organic radical activating enzyme